MPGEIRGRIVKIGNSCGVRIPKPILESLALGEQEEVLMSVEAGKLVMQPLTRVRQGWDEQFKKMASKGDDKLIGGDHTLSSWDDVEWTW
ncbi:MAG: AbrB/MazE/SpoVT family DNA-binding domain-containing protein [Candidatus Hydrogenedentes bacterium]|nr:AbrB/MazE/SpoVT family DNA-binding domain-containing protein [Candidatus Hydrogenedentota bacterium]